LVGGSIPSSGTILNVRLGLHFALPIRPLLLRFDKRSRAAHGATRTRSHENNCKRRAVGVGCQPANGFDRRCSCSRARFQKMEKSKTRPDLVQSRQSHGRIPGVEQPRHDVSGLVGGSIPSSGTILNVRLGLHFALPIRPSLLRFDKRSRAAHGATRTRSRDKKQQQQHSGVCSRQFLP
jgi:hypothetical protein